MLQPSSIPLRFIDVSSLKMMLSVVILMLISGVAHAKGAKGKQKINIHPSQVDNDSVTLTTEANIYYGTLYLNTSLAYSDASGWDISLSSQNIPLSGGGAQNFQEDTYFNLSRTFHFAEGHATTFGTQTGYQFYQQPIGKIHLFDFIDHEYTVFPFMKLHAGGFWVNSALSTLTEYVGAMTGIKLMYADWMIQADYFGGHTNVSGGVFNLNYYWLNNLATYIGVGVPERNSGNEFYGIIGFSLSNSSLR